MAGLFHLKQLGVQNLEQRPLLFPIRYEDLREPVDPGVVGEEGREAYIEAAVMEQGRVHMGRFFAALQDDEGRKIVIDGSSTLQDEIGPFLSEQDRVHLYGHLSARRKEYLLAEPRWVPEQERGSVVAVYPPLTRVDNDSIRQQVQENLTEDVARTAAWFLQQLRASGIDTNEGQLVAKAGASARSLAEALYRIHRPKSPEQGHTNIEAMERIVAWLRGAQALAARPQPSSEGAFQLAEGVMEGYLQDGGHEVNEEQAQVAQRLEDGLRSEYPLHHILSGTVNSGKTALFGASLVAVARAGGRVGLLVPSEAVGEQVMESLRSFWPEQKIHWGLPDPKAGPPAHELVVAEAEKFGGSLEEFDYLVVLEPQAYSAELRTRLLTTNANVLAVTPEAVPHVAALLRYEGVRTLRLHQTIHRRKVGVEILQRERDAEILKRNVQQTLRQDGQVLVMHPGPGPGQKKERQGPEGVLYRNWERQFPKETAQLPNSADAKKVREVSRNVRKGETNVVFCEPEQETSMYLPRLRQVVVLQAELFLRTDLQRLGARVSPSGGVGRLDLVCDQPDDAAAVSRLQSVVNSTDDEALVLGDYREGLGSEDWPLPGRSPDLEVLAKVAASEPGERPWEQ